ncbi:symmetrical bis(5'-nucleosyl)-tetraphosphatase [Candidatus Symbiobacter mobilis]|uniref:bis(5'-nucleosyl)-tetraphosphatase (symmetrical) n=1 Tax=Candidatus Symbiobacter mobilis CR TaxID=946483 RepID=U5NAJ1_9BURK|nr:symmetrical bis(5'-nucleosyl)-tetraphosphatase [Candidatus Symbiobacter mobilis]AGX87278.1 bis(5'-nucleosyl)-tetraphosphatase [Candidatus Symbiobacter mobilis CR]
MARYLVGDIQGCDAALTALLERLDFDPSRDTLYPLGDLVNRGPDSAGVLRKLMGYGHAVQCVLGNHDLHLLVVACGARKPARSDTLDSILAAPDRDALLAWLRAQPLARTVAWGTGTALLVHAGVLPQWTVEQTLELADEVHAVLRGPGGGMGDRGEGDALHGFLHGLYGNQPDHWDDALQGMDRLRTIVNGLTRLRFCTPQGRMDFSSAESANRAPPGCLPWFDAPGRKTQGTRIAFGHWSTLGWLGRDDTIALDTGCVWGGSLTALCIEGGALVREGERVQVECAAAAR